MTHKKLLKISLVLALIAPVSAFAFDLAHSSFKGVICYVIGIIALVTPILMAGALIFFFWGLSKYVLRSSGNEKELQVGKNYMLWGILALFVLLTFRAIVGIVTNEFDFGQATSYPFLPGSAVGTGVCTGAGLTEQVDSNIKYGSIPAGFGPN